MDWSHTAQYVQRRYMAREVVVRANYQRERQPEEEEAAVVVANGHRRIADAGRLLMLWGCGELLAGVVVGSTAASGRPADASSAVRAFLGLALWLLGVSLVALVPVGRRFPRAARAGAAVADAVMDYCFR